MKKGFTLVELLIVIAILAILSTLGLNNFRTSRIKAVDLSRKSDLQTVAKSLEAYVSDHKQYPLTAEFTWWGTAFTDDKGTIYAPKLPSNASKLYAYESDGKTYTLSTKLDNTQDPDLIPEFDCGTSKCNYKITSTNK